jgi:hypothetical protein
MASNDYKPGKNKFTGKITAVTIDTKPPNLSATDKKAVEDAEEVAATVSLITEALGILRDGAV